VKGCEYHGPQSVEEALALLTRFGADARLLAGGTDLVIGMRRGKIAPCHLIDLGRITALKGIAVDGEIALGALTTLRDVEDSPSFVGALRAVADAAAVIGGHQIRNAGTVAGNIANASPAADTPPACLCFDSVVEVLGPSGLRQVALEDLLLGPGKTGLSPVEMIHRVRIPRPPPLTGSAFIKIGRRQAMEISVVCVAARVTLAEDRHTCRQVRLAIGAAAPTSIRVKEAERLLEGPEWSVDGLTEAAQLAVRATTPISDVRASADYRRMAVAAIVPRVLRMARDRARMDVA